MPPVTVNKKTRATPGCHQRRGTPFALPDVFHDVKVRARATTREHMVTNHRLPATVQGGLKTALALDGAGSNDRGI